MKTILRNLFYTLKRFRTASVLNLLGLSTAFAAFMLIMMKASYEYNFDTCYPDSDRLVMLNFGEEKDNSITLLPHPTSTRHRIWNHLRSLLAETSVLHQS